MVIAYGNNHRQNWLVSFQVLKNMRLLVRHFTQYYISSPFYTENAFRTRRTYAHNVPASFKNMCMHSTLKKEGEALSTDCTKEIS